MLFAVVDLVRVVADVVLGIVGEARSAGGLVGDAGSTLRMKLMDQITVSQPKCQQSFGKVC